MPVQGQGRSAGFHLVCCLDLVLLAGTNESPTEAVADICTTPGCTEKKNPAEQVCFYCKQGRTGHIDEAMAGSSSSL